MGHRYVSPNAPLRTGKLLAAALILWSVGSSSRAEDIRSGEYVELDQVTDLYTEPSADTRPLGRLPKGTLVQLLGKRKGDLVLVEVELEDKTTEGWVRFDAYNDEDAKPVVPKTPKDDEEEFEKERRRPRRRVVIPKDEGVVIRRDPTFFYGFELVPGVARLEDNSGNTYEGAVIGAESHIGIHLTPNIPVRVGLGYHFLITGSTGAGSIAEGTEVKIGYLTPGIQLQYTLEPLEFFGEAHYAYSTTINDLPKGINISVTSDLSSFWVGGGAGYRFNLQDVSDASIRLKYLRATDDSVVNLQMLSLVFCVDFRG